MENTRKQNKKQAAPPSTKDLIESQAKYEAIVEAFNGLIYICSEDYKVEFMNKHFIERTGFNPVGQSCYKVIHNLDSVCPWCVNQKVFRGKAVSWEVLSPKDNRWYYVVNTPIRHPDGRLSKMAMIHDITDRKKMEEALQKKREQVISFQKALFELVKMNSAQQEPTLRKITEVAAKKLAVERVGIWLFNKERTEAVCYDLYNALSRTHEKGATCGDGRQARCFRVLEKSCIQSSDNTKDALSGAASFMDIPVWFRGKVCGLLCLEHTGPKRSWQLEEQDFAVALAEIIALALEASESARSEEALRQAREDLEERVQRRTIELVKANLELKSEISERTRIEAVLRESENQYRAIFENTGTAMIIIEEDMVISMANREFEKLSGYARSEVEAKKNYLEFIAQDDAKRIKEHHRLRRIRPEHAPRNYEFQFRNRAGGIRDIYATVSMIPGTKKSVASLMDVTE
ncbi:MAG TPA: PAS domain S-box protein [Patescibacteria group bacterium]|nr:PAS domain S-box protein [Patescibacteria group bacterium]